MGARVPPLAIASCLSCVSSLLRAMCRTFMSVELHKSELGMISHYSTLPVLEAQGHPTLGKGREHTGVFTHTSTPRWLCVNTCTHGVSIWRHAPCGTYLFRQKNIAAPVPAAEPFFVFFSLGFWNYFWFTKISPQGSLPDRWNSFPLRRSWWKSPLWRHF